MAYKRSRQAFEADLQKQESPYVFYGTPLPPLDENVRDDGSFVPVWKQEVTDDRGRKRLHGAFTGGFSAGYYNTVGSKEGWTPSAFVSSRQNRAKDLKAPKQLRPEDFMDEEDLREAEESRQLQTSSAFTGFGTEHDQNRKNTFMDLFPPSDESMGTKLLKRMGWKEGQGIGPRVKRHADLLDGKPSHGGTHFFAPADILAITFASKSDRKGLGYDDELSSSNLHAPTTLARTVPETNDGDDDPKEPGSNLSYLSARSKPKNNTKSGFGVGILNDTGSDDDEPYSMGPRISYNKVIGGDKKSKKKRAINISTADPTVSNKPTFVPKKLAGLQNALRKCHDGRLPMEGFVLADELDAFITLSIASDRHKPPTIPEGWESSFSTQLPNIETSGFVSVAEAAKTSVQDSKSRASALGEKPLPGKSVFDYLTPTARDRLATASGKCDLPPAMSERPPPGYEVSDEKKILALQELVPKLDQDVALQALSRGDSGWMPYAEDEAKRGRYRIYLEIRAGLRSSSNGDELPARAPNMSQDDWVVEMQEFARAAEVFRPVTGLMASRFTSSNLTMHPSSDENGETNTLLSNVKEKPENPADTAARMGMFGPMTRSILNFQPTRLLCKRFNVPMPDHAGMSESPTVSQSAAFATNLDNLSQTNMSRSAGQNAGTPGTPDTAQVDATGENANLDLNPKTSIAPIAEAFQVDSETNEALEQAKPGLALFKAIFGSDDEDENDDDDE